MAEENSGTICPICGKGKLKSGENQIYCSEYKPRKFKGDKNWSNEGTCNFHIFRENKLFKRTLTNTDFKKLFAGESIKDSDGNAMTFEKDNEYYTRIEFAPKKEDKDF